MLRWGLLGAGTKTGSFAPALRAAGHDLAIVGSRSLSRAQAFASAHGCRRARGSYEDVLAADDVDAVLVGLPTFLHEQWSTAALIAGKHVLCPPPLGTDAAAVARTVATAERCGRVLVDALPARVDPAVHAMLELARHHGPPALVHASLARPQGAPPPAAGGALLDFGPGALAVSRWVAAAEPVEVRALQRTQRAGSDETTLALLGFPQSSATVHLSYGAAHDVVEVATPTAVLRLTPAFLPEPRGRRELVCNGEVVGRWEVAPFDELVADFAVAVGQGRTADDAVATATVLDAVRRASG